jgi:hypothetical protein
MHLEPTRLRISAIVILLLTTAGCISAEPAGNADQPPIGAVTLVADAREYAPGDQVKITLANGSNQRVGYNICFAFLDLERRDKSVWTKVAADLGPGGNVACTAQLIFMPPGEEADSVAHLAEDLSPATYRIAYNVEVGSMGTKVATEAFVVAR